MEEDKNMVISMELELPYQLDKFHVTINNKFFIDTYYAFQFRSYYSWCYGEAYLQDGLRYWIQNIRKLYTNKKTRSLPVALCAQTSLNYRNGTAFRKGMKKDEASYELLQLCVGNQCLVYELSAIKGVPKVLKDLFCDKKTIVMGVGIENVTAKLQKDFGIMFNECVELRDLAAEANKGLEEKDLRRADVAALAKAVSGGEMDYVRPRSIPWWDGVDRSVPIWYGNRSYQRDPGDTYDRDCLLSHETVKHATIEVFLAQHIGAILLNKD